MVEHCPTLALGDDVLVLRPARLIDLQNGLVECLQRLRPFDPDPKEMERAFRAIDADLRKEVRVLVRPGNGVVGTVTWILDVKFYGTVFRVEDLAVHPEWAGKGLGGWMLQQSVVRADWYGAYKVVLTCKDELVPYYSQRGFRVDQHNMRMDREC